MVARRYAAPVRAAQAAASRRAILDAALRRFEREGYAAATLVNIAEEAGVAVETIYKHFGNKQTLLQQLLSEAVTGQVPDREAARGLSAQQLAEVAVLPDPLDRLEAMCGLAASVYDRIAAVHRIFTEAAGTDAEIRRAWEENRRQRVEDMRALVRRFADDGSLVVPFEEAVDITWLLAGPEVFTMLTRERGWDRPRYERWLFGALRVQLLGEAV